ncbi:MAG: DoxX family protein [Candidatus Moranbacteria bacterium GW2011_GWE1_35_17]|nr:MAG: DoxX family protein [Candidatus Moranbacteria bacterium GW2011_GWE1_35_17]
MNEIIKQFIQKVSPVCQDEGGENYAYAIFRIVVSVLFFLHGIQKFFGLFGGIDGAGHAAELMSLAWFAGLIEVAVGIAVLIGIFTRLAAIVGFIEMLMAYFMAHFPTGLNPLLNGGELALMFAVAFLIIFRYGAGKLSLEKKYCNMERF